MSGKNGFKLEGTVLCFFPSTIQVDVMICVYGRLEKFSFIKIGLLFMYVEGIKVSVISLKGSTSL